MMLPSPSLSDPSLNLEPGEIILAEFEPDLVESDAIESNNTAEPGAPTHLSYGGGRVVLSDRRVHYRTGSAAWASVELHPQLALTRHEHFGLGELSILETGGANLGRQIESFKFTLAQAPLATKFLETWQSLQDGTLVLPEAGNEMEAEAEAETQPRKSSGFALFRLLRFAMPELKLVLTGAALTFAATGAGLIPPYLTMPLVDEVLAPAGGSLSLDVAVPRVTLYLVGLGLAALASWLLSWAQGSILARVSERVSAELRVRAFAHLQRLGLRYFGGKRTGDLIARISSDTEHLCSFLSDTLIDFVTDVLMILGTAAVLITLDPMLALAALGSFPLIALLIVKVRGRLATGFLRGGRVWSAMTSILADTIPGIRVVKAFSQEQREVDRFRAANQQIVDVNNRVNALWTFFWPLVAFLNQIGLLVVWAVGAWQVLHNRITVGVLTAFVAYISRFYVRVESMSRILTATQRASAAAQRLFEILDREPEVMEPKDPLAVPEFRGELRFDQVSFRYGTRLVLSSVSFTVAPGQLVGIVGHTGSGKSTVANLICRFYDPASGSILVDGADIRRLPLQAYREHIGIVLQDPFLFFGTIAENVSYGAPKAPAARILEAARAARAHDFVLRLPEGYDSLVGERGQSLSGGERQRLAIARAIFVNPEILILDEATSAVDVQTEREIQRALDNVVKGRTTVAIAHRLSTLEKADLLVVLKHGHVVEMGSPAELMRADGEFAAMARAQSSGVAAEPDADQDASRAPEPEVPPLWPTSDLSLRFGDEGKLWASRDGVERRAWPRRCFPLSSPDTLICLVDETQREFACIESLSELAPASRTALLLALDSFEFLPQIQSITAIELVAAQTDWHVETDRGPCHFVVEQEDHVRPLPDGRYLVTDSHGMRYLLRGTAKLDALSRRLLAKVA